MRLGENAISYTSSPCSSACICHNRQQLNFKWDLRGSPYKSIEANYASIDFLLCIITNSIGINSRSKVWAHLATIRYNGVVVAQKNVFSYSLYALQTLIYHSLTSSLPYQLVQDWRCNGNETSRYKQYSPHTKERKEVHENTKTCQSSGPPPPGGHCSAPLRLRSLLDKCTLQRVSPDCSCTPATSHYGGGCREMGRVFSRNVV